MKGLLFFSLLPFLIVTACAPVTAPVVRTAVPSMTAVSTPTMQTAGSPLQKYEPDLKGLTLQVWHPWFGTDARLFEMMVEEFNNKNLWGFKVAATGQVNYSMLYTNVTAALPTADRPNMVIALPEQARVWDANGFVVDMTPYVNDPVYGWTSEEVRDIPQVFWLQDAAGERRVALPFQRSARFLLWNKTWAAELGFSGPPMEATEFRQQACAATRAMAADPDPEKHGLGGWMVDTDPMTALSWLRAFQGGVQEGEGYRFMTPNNIEAFKFLRSLQEEGCAWVSGEGVDPAHALATRKALFITADLGQFAEVSRVFAAENNKDDWVALAFPGQDNRALEIYGSSLVMLQGGEPAQLAAWLFMDWLLSPENDARSAKTTGLFPIRSSSLLLLQDYAASHPRWEQALEIIPQGDIQPQLGSWRKVRVMLGDGFTQMFRVSLPSGQVAAVLAQMESTANDLNR